MVTTCISATPPHRCPVSSKELSGLLVPSMQPLISKSISIAGHNPVLLRRVDSTQPVTHNIIRPAILTTVIPLPPTLSSSSRMRTSRRRYCGEYPAVSLAFILVPPLQRHSLCFEVMIGSGHPRGDQPMARNDSVDYLNFLSVLKQKGGPGKSMSIAASASFWYLNAFNVDRIAAAIIKRGDGAQMCF